MNRDIRNRVFNPKVKIFMVLGAILMLLLVFDIEKYDQKYPPVLFGFIWSIPVGVLSFVGLKTVVIWARKGSSRRRTEI